MQHASCYPLALGRALMNKVAIDYELVLPNRLIC
jgi:hypothetical protein